MAVAVKKYNPGFLTDDEIIESFCVRTSEFESIIECLRENTSNSSSHSLVIGPRGSGKTHLLLRVAVEVRRDETLAGLFPVVFPEESYEVSTCGEFWLECLGHLVEQAPTSERDSLRLTYNDLRTVQDDQVLADRCIGVLLDFADRHQKRLVLLVENLNMLFSDMGDPDAGWRLRKTLQTEPRVILLGSATSRFDEIDSPEHALYDLFRVVTLRPLDTEECEVLWATVSGRPSTTRAVRPLEILTGGNPRLLAIIARFGAGQSFPELMGNLLDLVDEHTEYFKSHLEALPPQERRVYLALARLWKPSTTREVSELARVDTNKCSSMLGRLVQRGSVAIEGGTARRKEYYLIERLYNIYYLLRRSRGEDRLIQALIEFMVCFYSPSELGNLLEAFPEEFQALGVLPTNILEKVAQAVNKDALTIDSLDNANETLDVYDQLIRRLDVERMPEFESQLALILMNKSLLLSAIERYEESYTSCSELITRFGTRTEPVFLLTMAVAYYITGIELSRQGDSRRALGAYRQVLWRIATIGPDPELNLLLANTVYCQGMEFIKIGEQDEALEAFDYVITIYNKSEDAQLSDTTANTIVSKGIILDQLDQTISETEFSILLECIKRGDTLPNRSLEAIVFFIVRGDMERAIDLIQSSPAAQQMLPLLTALQQELGQTTHVAKEVDEVAADIRRELMKLRSRVESRTPIEGGTQTNRDLGE